MNPSLLCPRFEKTVELISKRWAVLIVYQLLSGTQRFCTIESALPISGRVLSERLKDLEQEGIVKREVFTETPVRIEYSLTDKGRALAPVIQGLMQWSQEWIEAEESLPNI